MMKEKIRVFDDSPAEQELFSKYVNQHPESMFYHSYAYTNFLQKTLPATPQHLIAFEGKQIIGVLPLMVKEGPMGKVYNTLPYYGSNGGVLADSSEIAKTLIDSYNQVISENDVLASVWVENLQADENYKEQVRHNVSDYRIGQLTPIGYDLNHEEKLMGSFHYKTRNMVRKGMKSGFTVTVDNGAVAFLQETHIENMSAISGKAKSDAFFTFPDFFTADKDYKIWVASYEGQPVAALLLFYYNNIVEYYTPVIKEAFRDKQPLSYLICASMVEASQRGYKLWNWGGTWATQNGVYTFKKRWGTTDKNYNYFIQVNNDDVYSQSKEYLLQYYPDFFVVPFNLLKEQ